MNDKELADKVVAAGVGMTMVFEMAPKDTYYSLDDGTSLSAELFVRDWIVAGALMERFNYYELDGVLRSIGNASSKQAAHLAKVDPRAIIEACARS